MSGSAPSRRAVMAARAAGAAAALAALAFVQLGPGDPSARLEATRLATVLLGYGHLLGAAAASARRLRAALPPGVPVGPPLALAGAVALAGFAAWTPFATAPGPLLALLAASTWHALENDRALGALAGRGRDPVAAPHHLCVTAAGALGLVALGLLVAGVGAGRRGLRAADLIFVAVTLHHVVSFAALLALRARTERREGRHAGARVRTRALLLSHALPFAAVAGTRLPAGAHEAAAAAVLAPGAYLYWAVVHVASTVALRLADAGPHRGLASLPPHPVPIRGGDRA